MTYLLCLKKIATHMVFAVKCFWYSISALDFILLDGADRSWNISYFKSYWVWNKIFKY